MTVKSSSGYPLPVDIFPLLFTSKVAAKIRDPISDILYRNTVHTLSACDLVPPNPACSLPQKACPL